MNVLLIDNYAGSQQESMNRFAELMRQGLEASGHNVRAVRPPVVLGRLYRHQTGFGKWIGYLDRFVLYLPLLRRQVPWADVIHVCDQANAVYVPSFGYKPNVVTCHDVLAIRAALGEIPEAPTGFTGRMYQRWILRNLRKAQAVVCVSKQTQTELQRVVGHDSVTVVPSALNFPYRPMPAPEATLHLQTVGLGSDSQFFLHVGGEEWYKNRRGALQIFAALVKRPQFKSYRFVMVGRPLEPQTRQLVNSLGLQNRAGTLVDVSNELLRALYSTSQGLLFPSLYEGFGWPILEAQACGCLVVTTNRDPMAEVSGRCAILIDPSDPEKAAEQIDTSWDGRAQLMKAGLENVQRYNVRAMMDGYVAVYSDVIARQAKGGL